MRVQQEDGEEVLPGAVRAEPPVPFAHRLPGTESLGQLSPGDPASLQVDDPLHHLPMIPNLLAISQFPFTTQAWSIVADSRSVWEPLASDQGSPYIQANRQDV
jgi:hypothetical protein